MSDVTAADLLMLSDATGEGAMSPCCDQEGGLTHVACVSDSSLRDRVKEVFIERDRVQLSLLIGKGSLNLRFGCLHRCFYFISCRSIWTGILGCVARVEREIEGASCCENAEM